MKLISLVSSVLFVVNAVACGASSPDGSASSPPDTLQSEATNQPLLSRFAASDATRNALGVVSWDIVRGDAKSLTIVAHAAASEGSSQVLHLRNLDGDALTVETQDPTDGILSVDATGTVDTKASPRLQTMANHLLDDAKNVDGPTGQTSEGLSAATSCADGCVLSYAGCLAKGAGIGSFVCYAQMVACFQGCPSETPTCTLVKTGSTQCCLKYGPSKKAGYHPCLQTGSCPLYSCQ